MSKQRTRMNAVLSATGNEKAIRKSRTNASTTKQSVSLVPKPVKAAGLWLGIASSLNAHKYAGLMTEEPKFRSKMEQENKIYQYNNSVSGGRDAAANAYNMIMHQGKMQALERKHDKIVNRLNKVKHRAEIMQKLGQAMDIPIRGLSQMSQTMTRKAAYSQMVGSQSGVSRSDLAVASGMLANDTEFY